MTPNDADVQIIADLYHTELRTLLKSNRKNRKSRQPDPVKLMLEYSVSERVHVHEPGPGPGRTWIWSDLHLRHANIINYCSRPFADAHTMDRSPANCSSARRLPTTGRSLEEQAHDGEHSLEEVVDLFALRDQPFADLWRSAAMLAFLSFAFSRVLSRSKASQIISGTYH